MLEKVFQLKKNHTTPKTEFIAGITTFLTMSYILAVNPAILSTTGMDKGSIFVATCVASIIGTLIMAFLANWPVGLAPGMGLNGFFAYGVVVGMGYTWQQALGAVLISGVIFIFLSLIGARKWITDGIPQSLRYAITSGIGLFLAIIALKNAQIIVKNDATIIGLGSLAHSGPLIMILGFFLIAILSFFRFRGAIFIGILCTSFFYFMFYPEAFQNLLKTGFISLPPSLSSTFLKFDLSGIFQTGFVHVLLVFVLVEVLDATGSLIGVGTCGGLLQPGKPNNLNRALFADSCAIFAGALIGTSSTTAYVESAAGIEEGGRTGLTALFIAFFFALALFFSPLILAIPTVASAAALLFVAYFMSKEIGKVNWEEITDAIPALLTIILMPLTSSIANGLAFGFISYVVLKSCTGKWKEVKLPSWVIAILFIIRYTIE